MPRFIVLRGNRPQRRAVADRPGLRSGVLVDGEPVAIFHNRRQAMRAVARSLAAARRMVAPVCGVEFRDSPVWASLFSSDAFAVVPVELIAADGTLVVETPELDPGPSNAEKADRPRSRHVAPDLFAEVHA